MARAGDRLISGDGLELAVRLQAPLAFSTSLPPGSTPGGLSVCDAEGASLICQHRVLDRYPDGSARTVRTHFLPRDEGPFTLRQGPAAPPAGPPYQPLYDPCTGVVDNGCFRLQLPGGGRRTIDLRVPAGDGGGHHWSFHCQVDPWEGGTFSSAGREGSLEVEENGPVWCSLSLSGSFGGLSPLEYRLRFQVARGVPLLRWQCRFGNMSEEAVKIRSASCALSPVAVDLARSLWCEREDRAVLRVGDEERRIEGEVPGHLLVRSGPLELAWGLQDLSCYYPKALAAEHDTLSWAILPASRGPRAALEGGARNRWFDADGGMRVPPCFSWRTDGYLAWGPDAADLARLTAEAPLVRPLALPGSPWSRLVPGGELPPEVRKEADRLCASYESTQRDKRLFGLMDYGDLVGPAPSNDPPGEVWMNGEHDAPCGPLLYYLVSGQRRFWNAGCHAARHQLDVDLRRRGDGWSLAKHCAGHVTDRCENGHFWIEGLALYYRLTGDGDAFEALDHLGSWLAQDLAASAAGDFPTLREAGVSLWMLAVAFEVFPDRRYYLEILEPHVDALLALQKEDGAWHPYLKTDVALYRQPRYRKSMHLNSLAMGLLRYGEVSGDERIPPVLYRYLRRSLLGGDLLLPGGGGVIWDNGFDLRVDEDEPGLEPAEMDAAAFPEGQGAGYLSPRHGRTSGTAQSAPPPWDPGLFPLLEVVAFVGRHYEDPGLVAEASRLLDEYLARAAGRGLDSVRSFRNWTPLLQHLPAYLAYLRSRQGAPKADPGGAPGRS